MKKYLRDRIDDKSLYVAGRGGRSWPENSMGRDIPFSAVLKETTKSISDKVELLVVRPLLRKGLYDTQHIIADSCDLGRAL